MKLSQEQIAAVHQSVKGFVEKANAHYKRAFMNPVVRFDLRGRTGGQALLLQYVIRVNPVLCAENFDHYVKQTIGHEIAHLITNELYGKTFRVKKVQPHGREWKSVMHVFGLTADRCHQYDTTNSRARNTVKHSYSCNCRVHEIGPLLHKKLSTGLYTYYCKLCKGALKVGTQIGGSARKATVRAPQVTFNTVLERALGLR